jgi:hypothetical protein
MGLVGSNPKINHLGQAMTSPLIGKLRQSGGENSFDFICKLKKKPRIAAGLLSRPANSSA